MEKTKRIELKTAYHECSGDIDIENKPFNQCLICPDLGVSCNGPNMLAMTLERWCEWCRLRKESLGWTNVYISELTGVSVPTIDRIMSGHCSKDIRRSTLSDISRALVGGDSWGKFPCARPASIEVEKIVDNPDILKKNEELKEKINNLKAKLSEIETKCEIEVKSLKDYDEDRLNYLKRIVKTQEEKLFVQDKRIEKYRSIAMLALAGMSILSIIVAGAICIDAFNPNIGFFWLEK